jgi:3-oxoacyl-[acyl-carrier protein] reductase
MPTELTPSATRPLEGRVAVVTGAARGLGRAHALHLSELGAAVVVNDRSNPPVVVDEILARGGRAVPAHQDVSDWNAAGELIQRAIDSFGALHILVNNAGVLRDRTLAKLSEEEWDTVLSVHLKGHAATAHFAMAYWRERRQQGAALDVVAIHTTSLAGIHPNFGQANYAAAKAGIIALSHTMALEGARMGVRSNVVAPSAFTGLMPGGEWNVDTGDLQDADPVNVARVVGWLAMPGCRANAQLFHVLGPQVTVYSAPAPVAYGWIDGSNVEQSLETLSLAPTVTAYDALDRCTGRMRERRTGVGT